MKKTLFVIVSLVLVASYTLPLAPVASGQNPVSITVTVVNNPDQRRLLELTDKFTAQYPNIHVDFLMLPENELRDRVTTDITTKAGSFDVVQIGNYETPTWGKNGWLAAIDDLMTANPKNVQPNYDVQDLLQPIRTALSYNSKMYALPFYGESSMTYYNTKMFQAAGLTMPAEPTWDQIRQFACQLHKPDQQQYGIALRGLPGWGEVMAPLDTVVNTFGGDWFDMNWTPQLTSTAWSNAVNFYVDLLQKCGVPGAANNGFSESLTVMAQGQAAMWVDATVGGRLPGGPQPVQSRGRCRLRHGAL